MLKKIFHILITDIFYLLDIKLSDLLYNILLVAVSCMIASCVSTFLVGFPMSVYEELLVKKPIDSELKDKIHSVAFKIACAIIVPIFIYSVATR